MNTLLYRCLAYCESELPDNDIPPRIRRTVDTYRESRDKRVLLRLAAEERSIALSVLGDEAPEIRFT